MEVAFSTALVTFVMRNSLGGDSLYMARKGASDPPKPFQKAFTAPSFSRATYF